MDSQREPLIHTEERKTALSLDDFATQNQITQDRVWEMIEEGSISARFVNDAILILRDAEPVLEQAYQLPEIDIRTPEAPPEEEASAIPTSLKPATADEEDGSPEDPFSPVFPDAQDVDEVLLFAQDALARTRELSRQLLATKDELLRMKDERISGLASTIQEKDREIRALKRQIEDLTTLSKFEKNPRS